MLNLIYNLNLFEKKNNIQYYIIEANIALLMCSV